METFNKIYEARKWFRKYQEVTEGSDQSKYFYKHLIKHKLTKEIKVADWILFQHVDHMKTISRPILAVFVNFTIWDQALVIQFVEPNRAWTNFTEVWTSDNKVYKETVAEFDAEVQSIEFWTGDINLLGHWKNKPTLTELRKALT